LEQFFSHILESIQKTPAILLSPHSLLSIPCLLSTVLVAAGFYMWRRGGRPLRMRALWRGLFPRRIWASPSTRTDIYYALANTFLLPAVVAGAILARDRVDVWATFQLEEVFGPMVQQGSAPPALVLTVMIVALYLAYELAYWLDHYLCHKIPFLWQFHRVHHSATVLTPLTNWRMHPVDTIVFFNIVALFMGFAHAGVNYAFGVPRADGLLAGGSVVVLVAFYLFAHLQHSHVWMAAHGKLGRVVASPAHHQVHHSTKPEHFDRNFGHTLSLFDWAFGTLYVPSKRCEVRSVGLADGAELQGFFASLWRPFQRAFGGFGHVFHARRALNG